MRTQSKFAKLPFLLALTLAGCTTVEDPPQRTIKPRSERGKTISREFDKVRIPRTWSQMSDREKADHIKKLDKKDNWFTERMEESLHRRGHRLNQASSLGAPPTTRFYRRPGIGS